MMTHKCPRLATSLYECHHFQGLFQLSRSSAPVARPLVSSSWISLLLLTDLTFHETLPSCIYLQFQWAISGDCICHLPVRDKPRRMSRKYSSKWRGIWAGTNFTSHQSTRNIFTWWQLSPPHPPPTLQRLRTLIFEQGPSVPAQGTFR